MVSKKKSTVKIILGSKMDIWWITCRLKKQKRVSQTLRVRVTSSLRGKVYLTRKESLASSKPNLIGALIIKGFYFF